MLRDIDALCDGFQETVKKSKEQCGDTLEEMRQFIFMLNSFFKTFHESFQLGKEYRVKIGSSLTLTCSIELVRISGHILFFSYSGLYRQAFNNIRYALESIVQAIYLDDRHPNTQLETKIEILKEVENQQDYRVNKLITKLEGISEYKDSLQKEYSNLSKNIHHSHKQITATLDDLRRDDTIPVTINCEEIVRIFESLRRMYDMFLFLFITHFPELKEIVEKNDKFIGYVKKYNLPMLSKLFRI